MFEPPSRYYPLETTTVTINGQSVAYKRRRFLPRGDEMPPLVEVTISQGDRLDLVTNRTLGDPEQFWRVCDANNAMNPTDLVREIGRRLRVPVPQA